MKINNNKGCTLKDIKKRDMIFISLATLKGLEPPTFRTGI